MRSSCGDLPVLQDEITGEGERQGVGQGQQRIDDRSMRQLTMKPSATMLLTSSAWKLGTR